MILGMSQCYWHRVIGYSFVCNSFTEIFFSSPKMKMGKKFFKKVQLSYVFETISIRKRNYQNINLKHFQDKPESIDSKQVIPT